jgi:hypothetical protein
LEKKSSLNPLLASIPGENDRKPFISSGKFPHPGQDHCGDENDRSQFKQRFI